MKIFLMMLFCSAISLATASMQPIAESPKPVICIDPGHPSEVGSGTHGKHFTEMHVVWQVALLLRKRLEVDGYKVVMTKSTERQMVRNKARAEIANHSGAALLLRLHCDAAPDRGFATYYPSQQGKAEGVRGPSQSVLRLSKTAAQKLHSAVIESLNGIIPDRGLMTDLQTAIGHKQGALTGSVFSKVPVLLVEMVVLTNPKDETFLSNQDGFNRLAEALEAGVKAAVPKSD